MSVGEFQTGTVEILEPELATQCDTGTGGEADAWLCFWCRQRVAHDRDRLEVGASSQHTFVNPHGFKFHILTFSQVAGCLNVGTPTLEHTWFPGCAWSYCVCRRCRTHLGWFYTGLRAFVALIRDRIVRAAVVNN